VNLNFLFVNFLPLEGLCFGGEKYPLYIDYKITNTYAKTLFDPTIWTSIQYELVRYSLKATAI